VYKLYLSKLRRPYLSDEVIVEHVALVQRVAQRRVADVPADTTQSTEHSGRDINTHILPWGPEGGRGTDARDRQVFGPQERDKQL
jgi:hypothetical protein